MSKKISSVSAIDHFFYQRKDTFQIIGRYGLFLMRVLCFFGIARWIFNSIWSDISAIRSVILAIRSGMTMIMGEYHNICSDISAIRSVIMGEDKWSDISGKAYYMLFHHLFQPLANTIITGVAVVILFRLFRRYVKGDVFSMKNTGSLVALSTLHFIFSGAPVLGTLLLAVAVVVPSHDVDTPKTDA